MYLGLPNLGLNTVGSVWGPAALFASGAPGVWFDPSDFSTLFQDSAGTTPVTATGQPVGKILDKSGRANHATQATSTSRPTLQQDASGFYYLSFDGVDDSLATPAIDLTSTQQVAHFTGLMKSSDAGTGNVHEFSAQADLPTQGTWFLRAPSGGLSDYQSSLVGTSSNSVTPSPFAAPDTAVITAQMNLAAPTHVVRRNAVQVGTNGAATGGGNFGNQVLYIGRRGGASLPFNGRIYSLIVIGKAASASEIASTERWVGQRMGIPL